MRMILVGRHNPFLPKEYVGADIRGRDIQFPGDIQGCQVILGGLLHEANNWGDTGAAVVFQALPAQMVAAITRLFVDWAVEMTRLEDGMASDLPPRPRIGGVVSKPGERPAGRVLEVVDSGFPASVEEMAHHCNPNALIEKIPGGIRVTVDPPMRFEVAGIAWF